MERTSTDRWQTQQYLVFFLVLPLVEARHIFNFNISDTNKCLFLELLETSLESSLGCSLNVQKERDGH